MSAFVQPVLLLLASIFCLNLWPPALRAQEAPEPRTIVIILDGLASGAIDRIPLPHLKALKEEGCYYREIHLPLPDHPEKSSTYPWSCSLPNPALMSGTVFIGQEGIRQHLIQHSFEEQATAFVVNDGAYADVAGGFDHYINLRKEFADLFRDHLVFEQTKEVLQKENPSFLRVHLQGPGSAGHRSHEVENAEEPWYQNIWHPQSPYRRQLEQADELLAEFIGWLEEEGYMENTVLFILGDHGQATVGGHPPHVPASSKTELLLLGRGVKQDVQFDYAEITDLAPTIAHLHGLAPPKYADGRVLEEAFVGGPERLPDAKHIQELNQLLLEAHRMEKEGQALPEAFQGILEISTWHLGLEPVSIEGFLDRQRALLD